MKNRTSEFMSGGAYGCQKLNPGRRDSHFQFRKVKYGIRDSIEKLLRGCGWIIGYVILWGWVVFSILALIWIFYTSLKTNQEIFAGIWSLPEGLQWNNYVRAWVRAHIANYFLNSLFVTLISVTALAMVSSMAAYALARCKFKGSNLLFYFFLSGIMIPVQLILVPLYKLLTSLSLIDSLVGLIFIYVPLFLPFSIFVMTGFFRTLPLELEEAAALDGCSGFGIFWHIMFPLALPGVVVVAIFNTIAIWNEYLLALVNISTAQRRTLPLGIYNLYVSTAFTIDWAALFAGLVLLMLPTIVVFLILRKRIIGGLTFGALKG